MTQFFGKNNKRITVDKASLIILNRIKRQIIYFKDKFEKKGIIFMMINNLVTASIKDERTFGIIFDFPKK